ncbi:hypothetical protein [Saccharopolyspora phatthalungensis]|uniref:Uncharacterized protein n=1 Tax=Saccharopolyspora phatthalungensis TaxID=664693 RepID=A0A840Q772_9PSEU|nr:hypothetical protein [Saccharopolyspora phatthalungensis]MBB5156296.1 hypothetical protein [Saccharopolyspora phatthalungensis]
MVGAEPDVVGEAVLVAVGIELVGGGLVGDAAGGRLVGGAVVDVAGGLGGSSDVEPTGESLTGGEPVDGYSAAGAAVDGPCVP